MSNKKQSQQYHIEARDENTAVSLSASGHSGENAIANALERIYVLMCRARMQHATVRAWHVNKVAPDACVTHDVVPSARERRAAHTMTVNMTPPPGRQAYVVRYVYGDQELEGIAFGADILAALNNAGTWAREAWWRRHDPGEYAITVIVEGNDDSRSNQIVVTVPADEDVTPQ